MDNDELAYLNNHRFPIKRPTRAEKLAKAKEWLANAKDEVKRAKALIAKLEGK